VKPLYFVIAVPAGYVVFFAGRILRELYKTHRKRNPPVMPDGKLRESHVLFLLLAVIPVGISHGIERVKTMLKKSTK